MQDQLGLSTEPIRFRVRVAHYGDTDVMNDLLRQAYKEGGAGKYFQLVNSGGGDNKYVATIQRRIVGLLTTNLSPRGGIEMCVMYVLPEFRRLGIGSSLINRAYRDHVSLRKTLLKVFSENERATLETRFNLALELASPSLSACRMYVKMGLLEERDGGYVAVHPAILTVTAPTLERHNYVGTVVVEGPWFPIWDMRRWD